MPAHTSATKAGFLQRLKDRRFQILLAKQLMLLIYRVFAITVGVLTAGFVQFMAVGTSSEESDDSLHRTGYRHGPEGDGYYSGSQKID
ncbi:hypothetical protein QCD60_29680 [Pokkaliibacter sp. MBI-7]|uniref:hypothetical protein n=1 Tax=Pokkaliibacter sp. MBI-7 TaxID=3040600 RepID=UPI00244B6B9E|nr:hypothetical protein [Pokkaliibacter sp. MBI-7]MDH2430952.1 hypothetical protein [Pokkaliibacter sp. MBI-7]MDH2434716.1 hypothetical protein [Pokkaliibacter sp. MBI-7]MDH2434754.1 hypothetical protein [Pokkaliibacter sp. MBI-7]MDH2436689.1 hypothetical protein [Pokkaliibacter sp. MBI-7]